jgi:hypothetical protein
MYSLCARRRHKTIDTPEQVILWNALIEPELIEKTCLIATVPNPAINAISGITVRRTSQAFFDSIDPEQTWVECYSNTSSAR